jgi:PiT family inorganic phosphate transporter
VAVAETIGNEIVVPNAVNMEVIIAALLAAITWNILTWILGIPSSSSHALIGGIVGAVVVDAGFGVINLKGIEKILITLFTSPIIGLVVGAIIMKLLLFLCRRASPRVNGLFKKLQVLSSLSLALSHGTNDAQKTMGIITMGLVITGAQSEFAVPFWVILICAAAIAIGTSVGGWRLIRTLGSKFYKIRPIHGFAAQFSSASVILTASLVGGPVSTTQVVSSSILGVGAAERINKVRWGVAGEIITAWFVTIPSTALLAAGLYWMITQGIPKISSLFK